MRRIFTDDNLEKEIAERGYVVVKEYLDKDSCDDLSVICQKYPVEDNRAFTISNWNNDNAYRSKTFNSISQKVLPVSKHLLQDYTPVMGVYTVKKPGDNSDMLLHQDWSLVDESRFRSVSIWVALCDMDHYNGNLQLAEGSHLYCGFPRGMNIPVPFEDIRKEMYAHLTDVPLKKGDAIIFDHRVIHASPVNQSSLVRLAAVLALIPSEAEMIHYYKHPEISDALEVLVMDKEQFHLIDFFDMPNKPKHMGSKGLIPANFGQIDIVEVNSFTNIEKV